MKGLEQRKPVIYEHNVKKAGETTKTTSKSCLIWKQQNGENSKSNHSEAILCGSSSDVTSKLSARWRKWSASHALRPWKQKDHKHGSLFCLHTWCLHCNSENLGKDSGNWTQLRNRVTNIKMNSWWQTDQQVMKKQRALGDQIMANPTQKPWYRPSVFTVKPKHLSLVFNVYYSCSKLPLYLTFLLVSLQIAQIHILQK